MSNVGTPITDNKMVLQLINGLPKGEYDTIATMIQEEHFQVALVASNATTVNAPSSAPPPSSDQTHHGGGHGGGGCKRGRGNWQEARAAGVEEGEIIPMEVTFQTLPTRPILIMLWPNNLLMVNLDQYGNTVITGHLFPVLTLGP